ncbi:nitric oxide reductase F protein [Roseovarius salinarum]|uniref:nitric oxide reductase F protein n=1 Tax=Roseovarius salinarum TaxID=1981892 RepID=UPI000C336D10|nr:nitric oxide reductase F protein [Roseovarius salinarum]
MPRDPLLRAWAALVGLGLASTVVAALHWPPGWAAPAGALILVLAWLKARVILSRYLGLHAAPFWRRGFETALGLFCLLLLAFHLASAV